MSKKQKPAGHPGVGKSKIMKKLAKKLKRKYVDVAMPKKKEWLRWATPNGEVNPIVMEWLGRFPSAMAALRDDQLKNPYIFDPSVKTEPVQPRPIHICTDQWLVEDLDTNATCWDDQMDEMCRDFHTLRDRLIRVQDNDRLKLVDELLHRVIEVRCQLNTMKKEQS